MSENHSRGGFYSDASATLHALFILAASCMVGFSAYLTSHYFEIKYPEGLSTASLCYINSFFNCDVTTNSPLSNIFGVPISLFGLLIGLFALTGYFFQSERVERTNRALLGANVVGCTLLFLYSLIALGGLCPFCTLYYLASGLAAFVMWKHNPTLCSFRCLDWVTCASYSAIVLAVGGAGHYHVQKKELKRGQQNQALLAGYYALKDLGRPSFDSEYRLLSATQAFADAPIRITKFSDFECPACQSLSEVFHRLGEIERFQGKINLQYFFYPLDQGCNPEMKRPLHQNACRAAYLASCLPGKFPAIEAEIFAGQKELSLDWIKRVAEREGVSECVEVEETRLKVTRYVEAAAPFNVRSTPSWLLNGRKIEGALPLASITAIIDDLLFRQK